MASTVTTSRKKVLFLCTGNSCRSQMAEGWAKKLLSDSVESFSAGTSPHPLNELAVKVMREAGVDISTHTSKHIDTLSNQKLDLVVTVCDNAANSCPTPPPGTQVIHAPFKDPPQLAKNAATEEEALNCYRKVRDEIKEFVMGLPKVIEKK